MKSMILMFIVVVVALMPVWPYSRGWGYATSGWACLLGIVIVGLRTLRVI